MDALTFIEKLEKWVNCNEFTQQHETANCGMYGGSDCYQAINAEDLKQWLSDKRKELTK